MPNNVGRFSRPVRKSSVHGGAVITGVYEFTATDRPLMPPPRGARIAETAGSSGGSLPP